MQKSRTNSINNTEKEDAFSNFNEGPKELFQSGFGERFWLKNRGK